MTPLEDRIRQALRGQPATSRRAWRRRCGCPHAAGAFLSRSREAVREKKRLPAAWRGWVAPVAAAVVVAAVIAGFLAVSRALPARGQAGR